MKFSGVGKFFGGVSKGISNFKEELLAPSEYTVAEDRLLAAKSGVILDDEGHFLKEIDSKSEDGIALIKACEDKLHEAEANIAANFNRGPS